MFVCLHQVLLLSVLVTAARSLPAVTVPENIADSRRLSFKADEDDAVPVDRYVTHNEMTGWLQGLSKRYPNMVKVTSIGKSVENRDLWVLELSHSVGRRQRDLLMPMVKLVITRSYYYSANLFISILFLNVKKIEVFFYYMNFLFHYSIDCKHARK